MKIQTFCIFGSPVKHSISPELHGAFAKEFGLNIVYHKIEPKLGEFENAVRTFQNNGGTGANVTLPFKEEAYRLCDTLTPRAKIAKAVNTLFFRDHKIMGDNTDGIGFIRDIKNNLHYTLNNKKIILLGAGGAARGILQYLIEEHPSDISVINRTPEKAITLAHEFSINTINTLENQSADVVIDCLPANTNLIIPNSFRFSKDSLFYDLKYYATMLENNAAIKVNGYGMLVEQAKEAFFVWTGKRPSGMSR